MTDAGPKQVKVMSHTGKSRHHQLTFSAHALNLIIVKEAGTIPVTFKFDDHDESKTSITSATIVDKLGPNIPSLKASR
jgi:hypothetical protein